MDVDAIGLQLREALRVLRAPRPTGLREPTVRSASDAQVPTHPHILHRVVGGRCEPVDMDPTVLALSCLLAGCLLGGVATALVARTTAAARHAALVAERDLHAHRADTLGQAVEADLETDHELALALAPLTSSLARVERQVGTLERERTEQWGRIDERLAMVHASGEALRTQTTALAGALRSSTTRGLWGEVQLRRVVEHAGMVARVDFDTQVTGRSDDGAVVRPDAVVRLPGGKQVVVDAKAPMAAFLESAQEQRAGELPQVASDRQFAAAARHAAALRAHVDSLAAKRYWTAFTPTPELVVCFVPGEPFLAAACEADPALMEHAMAARVVLATPTTLLALLRTVALTWQQDALSGNARELFDLARDLHARLGSLGGHLGRLGRSLDRSVHDYNALVGTLERRVLVQARRMRDLDVTDADLGAVRPVEVSTRPLSAAELVAEPDRPERQLPVGQPVGRGTSAERMHDPQAGKPGEAPVGRRQLRPVGDGRGGQDRVRHEVAPDAGVG